MQRRPNDGEAKSLLENINRGVYAPTASPTGAPDYLQCTARRNQVHIPLERIKRNYDEASYRQLEVEIHNLTEAAAGQERPQSRTRPIMPIAARTCWRADAVAEAESEFREAISLDYNNASAHAGMARALEQNGRHLQRPLRGANLRAAAAECRWLPGAGPPDLKQNQLDAASDAVRRAPSMEPGNSAAQAMQREVTAKQTAPH